MPAIPEDKQCAQACSPRPGESLVEKPTAANEAVPHTRKFAARNCARCRSRPMLQQRSTKPPCSRKNTHDINPPVVSPVVRANITLPTLSRQTCGSGVEPAVISHQDRRKETVLTDGD
jgi:hypothetical protein